MQFQENSRQQEHFITPTEDELTEEELACISSGWLTPDEYSLMFYKHSHDVAEITPSSQTRFGYTSSNYN